MFQGNLAPLPSVYYEASGSSCLRKFSEDGSKRSYRNCSQHLQYYTVSHPKELLSHCLESL
jgi:hypothetical protein